MRIGRLLAAVVLSATAFTACGDDDSPIVAAQPSTTVAPTTTEAPKPIIVKDFTFLNLDVKAGTKLLVQNEGPAAHTLTADDGAFDTGRITAGQNVQFTVPSTPGVYKVKCTIHPTRMTGELKVT
jgi:plastocyanin